MTTPESCLVLRKSDRDTLIVAADFAAAGRTTATFHELVDLLDAEHNIWVTAPLPYGREAGVTGSEQVDRWAADISGSGLTVHAMIGFCGGNVYAAALAERVAGWQAAPRIILLDPGLAQLTMLTDHVRGWTRRYANNFTDEQLADLHRAMPDADSFTGRPLELAAALGGLFQRAVQPALMRAGHSAEAAQGLTDLVNGYLHWLGGASQLDPRPLWLTAPALNSHTPGFGLNLVPESERAAMVAELTWLDVSHSDLMRTPAVAAIVDELLSR